MKIAIDARWIYPKISGIGSYTQELITHLLQHPSAHEFLILFDNSEVQQRTLNLLASANIKTCFSSKLLPYSPFAIRSQFFLPSFLRQHGIQIFHTPNYLLPLTPWLHQQQIKYAITIHDLIPVLYPHFTPQAKKNKFRSLFRQIIRRSIRCADLTIVPSEATANDVRRHFQPRQMVVIPEGVNKVFQPAPHTKDPTAPTILYVGRFDPYKGLTTLIAAFAAVRQKMPQARLRVIGDPDPRYPESQLLAKELGIDAAIDWSGYVSFAELIAAYQNAAVFVLPSRYEGFGLPVLEAMASGTPVVCTNVSSLPEVAGDAALLVSPEDKNALAAALLKVLTDQDVANRLRQQGLERAAEFSWSQTAAQTIAAYEKIAGK